MTGDDVVALQERLLRARLRPGPSRRRVRRADRAGAARASSASTGSSPTACAGRPRCGRCASSAARSPAGARTCCASRSCCARPARGCAASASSSTRGTAAPTAASSSAGVAEADLMWDLARRLVGRMAATGMDAMLSRQEHTCPSEAERAAFANNAGADLVLSLHTDANHSMHAQGLATFHFGNGSGATSTVGEALAGLIQRELLTRTAMLDCRTQAPHLGAAAAHPHARRARRDRLPDQHGRPAPAARSGVPRRRRRGHPRRPSSGCTCSARTTSRPAPSPSPTCWPASSSAAARRPSDRAEALARRRQRPASARPERAAGARRRRTGYPTDRGAACIGMRDRAEQLLERGLDVFLPRHGRAQLHAQPRPARVRADRS